MLLDDRLQLVRVDSGHSLLSPRGLNGLLGRSGIAASPVRLPQGQVEERVTEAIISAALLSRREAPVGVRTRQDVRRQPARRQEALEALAEAALIRKVPGSVRRKVL